MTYRILQAVNGYYYVQQNIGWRWTKTGGFFFTKRGAENFIRSLRQGRPTTNRVVGYY